MTISSIAVPYWVSYSVTTGQGETYERHIGLHKSCSNLDSPQCRGFPYKELCQFGDRYFCSMWRTIGFMESLAAILCLACVVSFIIVISGGKYKRETNWPFVVGMLSIVSLVQFIIISMVVSGWSTDSSFLPFARFPNLCF